MEEAKSVQPKVDLITQLEMSALESRIEEFVESIDFLWAAEPLDGDIPDAIGYLVTHRINEINGNLGKDE